MARPKKKALDYFPFDVDFFGDDKILPISKEFGIKGELAAVKLLCAIYRNGYFAEWSDRTRNKLLGELPTVSEKLLDEIVSRLVRWGFFDKALFDSAHILTSHGIQKRYFEVVRRCKRQVEMEGLPHLLVGDKEIVSTGGNHVSTGGNPVSTGGNPTKEKETKVSLIKETKVSSIQNNHHQQQPRVYASVREEVSEMKNSQSWIENVCMRFHLSPDDLSRMLDDFALDCECRGKSVHDSLPDAQCHFISWVEKRQQGQRSRNAGTSGQKDQPNAGKHKWQSASDIWIPKSERPDKRERRWQS